MLLMDGVQIRYLWALHLSFQWLNIKPRKFLISKEILFKSKQQKTAEHTENSEHMIEIIIQEPQLLCVTSFDGVQEETKRQKCCTHIKIS